MTQPAATKMLHEAEDLLGVELFERLPRGMRATPFGETLIYYSRMIFAELSGMREELVALSPATSAGSPSERSRRWPRAC